MRIVLQRAVSMPRLWYRKNCHALLFGAKTNAVNVFADRRQYRRISEMVFGWPSRRARPLANQCDFLADSHDDSLMQISKGQAACSANRCGRINRQITARALNSTWNDMDTQRRKSVYKHWP